MTEDKMCAHEGCVCKVSGDTEYCSSYCENSSDHSAGGHKCECGHKCCE